MEKLTHLKFAQGERYPMLLDADGMPDFWVTLYVTEKLRADLKQTTIENSIRHIIHLKLWERIHGRDLIFEISQGKFLSEADIYSLRDHCLSNTRALRSWLRMKSNKSVAKLTAGHPSTVRQLDSVSKEHAANRLTEIANFYEFTAKALLRKRSNFTSMAPIIDMVKKLIEAQKPEGQSNKGMSYDPDSKAPPAEVFEKFMGVIAVDSPDNPYKNLAVRTRNALMVEVLYETGMRSGEVLALRVGDVDYNVGKVKVVRRHDDPLDPRKKQPVAKTLERNLDISVDLARRIRAYVMDMRSQVISVKSPPFLFVTHKRGRYQGQPISDVAFRNRILLPAIETNPEQFEEIKRHGFRHNHNFMFSEKVDAINALAKTDPSVSPISPKAEIQTRKHQYGWESDETAETYNVRHTREIAKRVALADAKEMAKHLKKGKK